MSKKEIKRYMDQALARVRFRNSDIPGVRCEHGIVIDMLYFGIIKLDDNAAPMKCLSCGDEIRTVIMVRTTQLESAGNASKVRPRDLLLCEPCGNKYDEHILPMIDMVNNDIKNITGAIYKCWV